MPLIADLAMQVRHLEQAELHVAQGERHIARQEVLVTRLALHGHNVTEARKLLDNLYVSQALLTQHRDQIRKELER